MAAALREVILRRSTRAAAETRSIPPIGAYFVYGGYDKFSNPDLHPVEDNEEEFINYVSDGIIAHFTRRIRREHSESKIVRPHIVKRAFFEEAAHRFEILPEHIQMMGWDKALDQIQDYPEADSLEVFRVRMEIRKRTTEYPDLSASKGITKDKVISRVLGVMKYYPKLDMSKLHSQSLLMKEGHFNKDLGLNEEEWANIRWGLEQEFMLERIPEKIESCKLVVEYIYENIRTLSSEADPTADQVYSLASLVIKVVDHFINNNISSDPDDDTGSFILRETLCLIGNLVPFQTYPASAQLSLISTVLDHFQKHPKVNSQMVYYLRMYIRSMLKDEGKDDIIKVQEDSKFHKEPWLNEEERKTEMNGLELESWALDVHDNCMKWLSRLRI